MNASFNDHASLYTFAKTNPSFGNKRAGHLGAKALEALVWAVQGVRIKGVKTINCEACSRGKASSTSFGETGNTRQKDRSEEFYGTFSCSKDFSMASITLL
jgi:hypothetical protein